MGKLSLNQTQPFKSEPRIYQFLAGKSELFKQKEHKELSKPAPPETQNEKSELQKLFPNTFSALKKWFSSCEELESEPTKNQLQVITSEPKSFQKHQMNSEPTLNKKQPSKSEPNKEKLHSYTSYKHLKSHNEIRKKKKQRKPKEIKKQRDKSEPRNSQKPGILSEIREMSKEELAKAIRIARDKAYDGKPLSPLENFLFEKFLDMGIASIEELAEKLKKRYK